MIETVTAFNPSKVAMAGPIERREREKKELRTKILDAARELFAEHGYEAVTMRKIAERIEYSPTAIYLYFKDKEALIAELCRHDFVEFAKGFLEFASLPDPLERLRRAGWAYLTFAVEHPQHYQLMFMTRRPLGAEPQGGPPMDPAENAYVFLRATVAQALAEGRLREALTDVDLVAQTIWAATHGVVSLEISKGSETKWVDWRPLRERMGAMIDLVLDSMVRGTRADEPPSAPRQDPHG